MKTEKKMISYLTRIMIAMVFTVVVAAAFVTPTGLLARGRLAGGARARMAGCGRSGLSMVVIDVSSAMINQSGVRKRERCGVVLTCFLSWSHLDC